MRKLLASLIGVLRTSRSNNLVLPPNIGEDAFPRAEPVLMGFLHRAYRSHGAHAAIRGNWVVVDKGRLFTRASYAVHEQQVDTTIVRTDFFTVLPTGECIVEAFAGVGESLIAALEDSCQAFLDCSFHAILAALSGHPCEHVEIERMELSGAWRKCTFGCLRICGNYPESPPDSWTQVRAAFDESIMAAGVSTGLHWVRLFYAKIPGHEPSMDMLLDNEPWSEVQKLVPNFPWPESDHGYMVRMFFIIQDT